MSSKFKDRFHNRTETVRRDGTNSSASTAHTPYQQQQQQPQQQQYQPYAPMAQPWNPQGQGFQQPTNLLAPLPQMQQQQQQPGGQPLPPWLQPLGPMPTNQPSQPLGVDQQQQQAPMFTSQEMPSSNPNNNNHPVAVPPLQQTKANRTSNLLSASSNQKPDANQGLSPSRLRKPALPDFASASVEHAKRRQEVNDRKEPIQYGAVDHPVNGNYKSHTLEEYKKMQEEYRQNKWGGLGMNDSEEAQRERERRKRIMEYSKNVNIVNFAVMDVMTGEETWHNRKIERKPTEDAAIAQAKRQRALQYADHYRPKPKRRTSPAKHAQTPEPVLSKSIEVELTDLQEKHRRDQEAIQRIKKQLSMM